MSKIEGVPVGCKLVGIRTPELGEAYIGSYGCVCIKEQSSHCPIVRPIIEADNVYGVLDLTTVPIPEGYERAGNKPEEWFRVPMESDEFVARRGKLAFAPHYLSIGPRIILRPIKKKRKFLVVVERELSEDDAPVIRVNVATPFGQYYVPFRIEERD